MTFEGPALTPRGPQAFTLTWHSSTLLNFRTRRQQQVTQAQSDIKPTSPQTITNHNTFTMSAPNQGRQSPEPEQQSEGQKGVQAGNVNDQGKNQPGQQAGEQSKEQLKSLGSNPGGPLDQAAKDKTSKE